MGSSVYTIDADGIRLGTVAPFHGALPPAFPNDFTDIVPAALRRARSAG